MNIGNLGAAFQGWGAGQDIALAREKERQQAEYLAAQHRQAEQDRMQGQNVYRAMMGGMTAPPAQQFPTPPGVGQPSTPTPQPSAPPPPQQSVRPMPGMTPMQQALNGPQQSIAPYQAIPQGQPQPQGGGELSRPPVEQKHPEQAGLPSPEEFVKRAKAQGYDDQTIGMALQQYMPMYQSQQAGEYKSRNEARMEARDVAMEGIRRDTLEETTRSNKEKAAIARTRESSLAKMRGMAAKGGYTNVEYMNDPTTGVGIGFRGINKNTHVEEFVPFTGTMPAGTTGKERAEEQRTLNSYIAELGKLAPSGIVMDKKDQPRVDWLKQVIPTMQKEPKAGGAAGGAAGARPPMPKGAPADTKWDAARGFYVGTDPATGKPARVY